MTNQKNRFFTLVFSCCPGAGEMYMGLYKQGISLMVLFFGAMVFGAWLGWEVLVCPVVWCYSFFHTHNLRRLSVEEFSEIEDKFIFEEHLELRKDWKLTGNYRRFCSILLFLIGISIIWRMLTELIARFFYMTDFFWYIGRSVPQVAMALLVLYAALRLMRTPQEDAEEKTQEESIKDEVEI